LLVSFPPLSNMLKSSGSSCQFEARLGDTIMAVRPQQYLGILADDYNRVVNKTRTGHPRALQAATIDAVLRQPTTLVTRITRLYRADLSLMRCVSSLQATQRGCAVTAQSSAEGRGTKSMEPIMAKTRRVRTTGTQTGMLPGISRKRNMRSKF
jgi:hypothetical protein